MTNWLIHKFVKDYENTTDEKVRLQYGLLTSIVGIFCNIGLFVLKLWIGLASASISIVSDAFNNLSDSLSCVVTLFSYRLSAKPADQEHPFGHGRIEYVASFVMTIVIFVVGFELLRTSIGRIQNPQPVIFSLPLFLILAASVLVKIWLAKFNEQIGVKIDNLAMQAAGKDAQNDVLATSVTLISMLLSLYSDRFPYDGIAGIALSGFIFFSGYEIGREIIGKLLGSPASFELTNKIESLILSYPEILGVHDLMIHDYGPGVKIGSAHAEVDADMDFRKAHDVVDQAEKAVNDQLHVLMTLHLDPIEVMNPEVNHYRKDVEDAIKELDSTLSMHDFRMVKGDSHTNLVFDILIPYGCKHDRKEIQAHIDQALAHHETPIYTRITFDHDFTEAKDESNHERD